MYFGKIENIKKEGFGMFFINKNETYLGQFQND